MAQIPFQRPIEAPVADEGVVSPTNTGNGGGYTSGGYDAYGGGTSYAIGNENDEGDGGHNPYRGTA